MSFLRIVGAEVIILRTCFGWISRFCQYIKMQTTAVSIFLILTMKFPFCTFARTLRFISFIIGTLLCKNLFEVRLRDWSPRSMQKRERKLADFLLFLCPDAWTWHENLFEIYLIGSLSIWIWKNLHVIRVEWVLWDSSLHKCVWIQDSRFT